MYILPALEGEPALVSVPLLGGGWRFSGVPGGGSLIPPAPPSTSLSPLRVSPLLFSSKDACFGLGPLPLQDGLIPRP